MFYYKIVFFGKPYSFYTYASKELLSLYSRVQVSFGRVQRIGLVWKEEHQALFQGKIKEIEATLDIQPLFSSEHAQFLEFCATYYNTPLQEVLDSAILTCLKKPGTVSLDKKLPINEKSSVNCLPPYTIEQQEFINKTAVEDFVVHVLEGITGSGKTRCYQGLIQEAIKKNKSVLVLIPEINLAPQMQERLQGLGAPVYTYHSELSIKKRLTVFFKAQESEPIIVLSTRSGIFLPLTQLGLVVVDEEHDRSYKEQHKAFAYQARDLAIKKASLSKCLCVLGSATPSLQTLHHVKQGKYQHSPLIHRATAQQLASISIVRGPALTWKEPVSYEVLKEIRNVLQQNQHVLIYVNRRGYIPALYCPSCAQSLRCPHCITKLTLHQEERLVICHHCSFQTKEPTQCKECQAPLVAVGLATQRLAEFLTECFPSAPVFILDTDHIGSEKDLKATVEQIQQTPSAIIIGTQMVSKGHDWKKLTLAVFLMGYKSLDEELDEESAQQLVQVCGRVGRHQEGKVLIPISYEQEVAAIWAPLLHHRYHQVAQTLLMQRKERQQPPFIHFAKLVFRDRELKNGFAFFNNQKKQHQDIEIIGPFLDYPPRRNKLWQIYAYVCSSSKQQRSTMIRNIESSCSLTQRQQLMIDIDPIVSDL